MPVSDAIFILENRVIYIIYWVLRVDAQRKAFF